MAKSAPLSFAGIYGGSFAIPNMPCSVTVNRSSIRRECSDHSGLVNPPEPTSNFLGGLNGNGSAIICPKTTLTLTWFRVTGMKLAFVTMKDTENGLFGSTGSAGVIVTLGRKVIAAARPPSNVQIPKVHSRSRIAGFLVSFAICRCLLFLRAFAVVCDIFRADGPSESEVFLTRQRVSILPVHLEREYVGRRVPTLGF